MARERLLFRVCCVLMLLCSVAVYMHAAASTCAVSVGVQRLRSWQLCLFVCLEEVSCAAHVKPCVVICSIVLCVAGL